jgi:hypothetical protein
MCLSAFYTLDALKLLRILATNVQSIILNCSSVARIMRQFLLCATAVESEN